MEGGSVVPSYKDKLTPKKLISMRYLLLHLCLILSFSTLRASDAAMPMDLALIAARKQHTDSLQQALDLALQQYQRQDSLIVWIDGIKAVARIFRDELNEPEQALNIMAKASPDQLWRQPNKQEEWEAIAWLEVNRAYTYKYGTEQYIEASQHYQRAKEILVDQLGQEDLDIAIYIYQEWGNLKTMMGDFVMAEVLLNQFLQLAIQQEAYDTAAEGYNDQGVQFISQWDISRDSSALKKAISYLQEGLTLPHLHDFPKGLLHGNLVKCYIELGQKREVLYHATKGNQAIQNFYQASQYPGLRLDQAKIKQNLGEFFLSRGELKDALLQFETAAAFYLEVYPAAKHRELARTFSAKAQVLALQSNWTEALRFHQKAIAAIIGEFESETALANPNPRQLRAERVIAEVLEAKANTLKARYEAKGVPGDLVLALDCHELIYQVERQIRSSYLYERSKLNHISKQQRYTEQAVEMAFELWKKTNDERYADIAFRFIERNKSTLLLEAFQQAQAHTQSGQGAAMKLLEQEQQLAIADLEKTIYQAQMEDAPDSVLLAFKSELLTLQQSYQLWLEDLAAQNPTYYALKYQDGLQTRAAFQALLQPQQTAVEYFVGTAHIYAFVLNKEQSEWVRIDKDFPLEDWVTTFRKAIEDFQLPGSPLQELCTSYSQLGHQLYTRLIAPLQQALPLSNELLIIPSGILSFLPFEALLSEENTSCQFSKYPYLVLDHQIQYTFSASLQQRLLAQVQQTGDFLGFAPSFEGQGGFGALYKNQETVQAVQEIWGGQVLLRDSATKHQFISLAPKHQIIHLSTHAKVNMEAENFSFIVFADGNGGYDSLYTRDIYLLALDAEMVILSACETGIGRLHQGEGLISLARGFLYAGAKSVITTLWQINDEANYKVSQAFFENLKKGQNKAQALQAAKISHIQESDNMNAHPVYWAAFVGIGNERAITQSTQWLYVSIGVFILLLLSAYLLISKRPRVKANRASAETVSAESETWPIEA